MLLRLALGDLRTRPQGLKQFTPFLPFGKNHCKQGAMLPQETQLCGVAFNLVSKRSFATIGRGLLNSLSRLGCHLGQRELLSQVHDFFVTRDGF
jgi:hypothetical protein